MEKNNIIESRKLEKSIKEKLDDSKYNNSSKKNESVYTTTIDDSNSDSFNKIESINIKNFNNNNSSSFNDKYSKNNNENENMHKINMNTIPTSKNTFNNIINNHNIPNIYFDSNNSNNFSFENPQNENAFNQKNKNVIPLSQQILQTFSKASILNALQNQNQTIYLQKQLRVISKETIDYIIDQLKRIFRVIMKDKNGNYFTSDLFKECTEEQRIKILQELSPTLSDDCLNRFASHPVQTLIDRASSEIEFKLILYSFNDYNKLLYVALDSSGSYTIQKIIQRIPSRFREEFNFIFASFIGFISRKKYGIVAVKRFISDNKSDVITNQIMKFIEQNFMNISMDQYANYLIQFLLEEWKNTPEGNEIKKLVKDNFEQMCQKRYSSFICELYIKIISPAEKLELINSLKIKNYNTQSNNLYLINILGLLGCNNISNNPVPLMNNIGFNMNNNMQSRFDFKTNNSNESANFTNYNIPFNNKNKKDSDNI